MRDDSGPGIHRTQLVFRRDQARLALERAMREDVERGGSYDAASRSAINIWSRPWSGVAAWGADAFVGAIYVDWGRPAGDRVVVFALQAGPNATFDAVYRHVTRLFGEPLPARAAA